MPVRAAGWLLPCALPVKVTAAVIAAVPHRANGSTGGPVSMRITPVEGTAILRAAMWTWLWSCV
ncbi:hypothetical protein COCSUDRAFT_34092 [Coccomyxa subellipsoidea C-169]|uniref:Secreted protein n=1 Tax=Coccomyxa subellipsoidea (strain C-169) TaxID=574566 RepID=I0YPG5_COCSC|nr:hypothetical protein COCSUDRAFT_34092 [Coccomyxa subellipsoidea C-169]EIE20284.1 hypothetical protein COCSUDRAFT_34092 [Coccomyxa subellipsoidea C-169]|eukprot:XP_005644828.1 hypothetical protein COCSUDRAFT_34092 [Coccomyxa subellipsoidea C-169]